MPTAYITHPACELHDMGAGHPESPRRLQSIREHLTKSGLMAKLDQHEAPLVKPEVLALVHRASYLEDIETRAPKSGLAQLDPDTAMNPHSLEAARRAAGAVVLAVDLVMTGKVRNAFCAVRPPGHHALSNRSMGFCIYNNVAVAAAYARAVHGIKRVAILDFDVHHGNGTEEIFIDEPNVMLCSTFQHPYYPYQGADTISDHIINSPIAANSGSKEFRAAVMRDWLPNVMRFKPDLIMFSAGFDAHQDDPLAYLKLSDDDYRWVTEEVVTLANECCDGRIVSTLEGGYNLEALGRSVTEHVGALINAAR
jgi:acetoin utilization deacetylase AcuC-like enzyme